jgi:hypothetical protein
MNMDKEVHKFKDVEIKGGGKCCGTWTDIMVLCGVNHNDTFSTEDEHVTCKSCLKIMKENKK